MNAPSITRSKTAGMGLTAGPAHSRHRLSGNRVDMRAHDRRLATVVTISGDIDATNIDRVSEYTTRFVLVGNAIILDLSDVYFIAAQGISVLIAIDDVYCAAAVHWALVPSHAVSRLLRISDHDNILPTASSVPEAMRHLAKHARVRRRQLPLVTTTA
jgi:anti-anti-sigma factor